MLHRASRMTGKHPPGTTKQTVYFTMVLHPLKGWVRTGQAKASRDDATQWLPVVRGAWRGCRTKVSQLTIRFVDGVMDEKSRITLDKKFNMDPPQ